MTDTALIIRVTSTLQQHAAQAIVDMIAAEEIEHGVGHVNGRFFIVVCNRQISFGLDEIKGMETLRPVEDQVWEANNSK